MAVDDIEVGEHAETAAVVGDERSQRRGHAVERLDARACHRGAQLVHHLGVREYDAAQRAVLRLALGVRAQLAVHFLEPREQVRQLVAAPVQPVFVGEGGGQREGGVLHRVGLDPRLLVRGNGVRVFDKGAVVNEKRPLDGQQHLLGGGGAEAYEQPVVAQERDGRPVALDGARMAGKVVAQRQDAAHHERRAGILEPAIGLEHDLHREFLARRPHLCSPAVSGCANVQRFLPVSLPRYSARSTRTKFSANVRLGS